MFLDRSLRVKHILKWQLSNLVLDSSRRGKEVVLDASHVRHNDQRRHALEFLAGAFLLTCEHSRE